MRVAVLTHADQIVGGAETYLDTVLGRLAGRGFELALCAEVSALDGAAPLAKAAVNARIPTGPDSSAFLRRLAEWTPDVMFLHGLEDVRIERGVTDRWPTVFFAHTYHGTCISSSKTWSFPSSTPCTRTLGPGCLVHYLPHRCGGLSPASMWAAYQLQQERRALIPRYARVLTLSQHMRAEYIRHGASSDACHVLPHFARQAGRPRALPPAPSPLRLLFVGRMERLKGAHVFVDTLPLVAERLSRPVQATLVGDGRCRGSLERQADALSGAHPDVHVQFTGWLPGDAVLEVLRQNDLVVVPSLWPEPFGLVGPEAGALGVPAAAFDVGGIPEWLLDGETGHLARGSRIAASLAEAIVACVGDAAKYRVLSEGALALAARRTLDGHVDALEAHLAAAAGRSPLMEATVAS